MKMNTPTLSFVLGLMASSLLSAKVTAQTKLSPRPKAALLEKKGDNNAVNSGSLNSKVVIAIIDTGIDISHPAIKESLWINPGESGLDEAGRDKATNGIDDDGNGYIDDVHGWNFVHDNHHLKDRHGHGTHIAGIISAGAMPTSSQNDVRGMAPDASLMILKYYDPTARHSSPLANTIKAIRYATKMGAHIINYSGGGLTPSELEKDAISAAAKKNILFVAAAGNEASNADKARFFPASYELSNILAVTAVDTDRRILATSNYGQRSIAAAAPGYEIRSTLPGGKYGTMTGTSQATAFVSAAAALLIGHHWKAQQKAKKRKPISPPPPERLIERLTQTGSAEASLIGKTKTATLLDVHRTLVIKGPNESVSGVSASNIDSIEPSVFSVGDPSAIKSTNSAHTSFKYLTP